MNRHRLIATLLSPLVVRKERQSQRSEGVSSLPGTLVRGALARLYLEQRGEADAVFQQLFVDEQTCRYGPLDPGERVFPRSAASCKREGGFATEGKHGMIDLLWSRIARRLLVKELPEPWRKNSMDCCYPKCENDLKAKEGFWTIADGVRRRLRTAGCGAAIPTSASTGLPTQRRNRSFTACPRFNHATKPSP